MGVPDVLETALAPPSVPAEMVQTLTPRQLRSWTSAAGAQPGLTAPQQYVPSTTFTPQSAMIPQAHAAPMAQNTCESTPICSTSMTSQIFTAPAQPYVPSTQSLSSPMNYTAQSYAAPVQTLSSPMNYSCQTYAAPAQTLGSPMSYAAPSYAPPAQTLGFPMSCTPMPYSGHGSPVSPSMMNFPAQQMAYAAPDITSYAPTAQSMSYLPLPMDPTPQVPMQNMSYVPAPAIPAMQQMPMQSMPTMPMQSMPMQQMPALSCTTSTSTALMTPPQHMSPQISPRAQVQSMSYVPVPPAQQMSFVQPVMQQPMMMQQPMVMQQPMMMQQPTSSITAPTTNFMPVAQPPQQTYISIPSAETYAPPAQLMSASATPSMTTTTLRRWLR